MRWGCTGSLDMLEYEVMRSPISSQGVALFWGFLDLSRSWESPGGIYERRISRWLISQHWVRWRGLDDNQRQARELISEPCLCAKARYLSFDRTQSRAVSDLLTGHNTLRRRLHLLGMIDSPLCRRSGAEDETSAHILCKCVALASLRHASLGSFFLEPEDIRL